jgi:pyruvate dehydrogenase E2 component (dihydrolipoamide acetyltransferase)
MEGLHHDTVLDVPRSVTQEEELMPSTEKRDGADQQKRKYDGEDKAFDNDAPKTNREEETGSDNKISSEGTETIPEKNADEQQILNETLMPPKDNISEKSYVSPFLGEGSNGPGKKPTQPSRRPDEGEEVESSFSDDQEKREESSFAARDAGEDLSGEKAPLPTEIKGMEVSEVEGNGEPSSSDDSPEPRETASASPKETVHGTDALKDSSEEDHDGLTASSEKKNCRTEISGNVKKKQLNEKIIPVTKAREKIAAKLAESMTQIPHFYLQREINAGPLLDAQFAINKKFSKQVPEIGGGSITLNDLVLKGSIEAINWVPEVNASWQGNHIKQHGTVHLAFGVAVEDGLIAPVIHNAEAKHLHSLSFEAKQLISKARAQRLSPEEMSGSTFTVTNLGMYGIDAFSSIINPPNAAILSIGATKTKPIVDDLGKIALGRRMVIGLNCDHRVVDGAVGSSYLKALAEILENPTLMLV